MRLTIAHLTRMTSQRDFESQLVVYPPAGKLVGITNKYAQHVTLHVARYALYIGLFRL